MIPKSPAFCRAFLLFYTTAITFDALAVYTWRPLVEPVQREPYEAPRLVISDRIPDYAKTGKFEPEWLEKAEPADFLLEGYQHHPPLTASMAV